MKAHIGTIRPAQAALCLAGFLLLEGFAGGLILLPGLFEPLLDTAWFFWPGLDYDPSLKSSTVAIFAGFGLLWLALFLHAFAGSGAGRDARGSRRSAETPREGQGR